MSVIEKVKRSLARDADLPLGEKLRKGARFVAATVTAPFHLRACDRVGEKVRTIGAPRVRNLGTITIGDRAILNSTFAPIEIDAGPGARVAIGDDVAVNFGARIDAIDRVELGSRVSLGPYVMISDHDDDGAASVTIGDDVWLATRVTVKKGVTIGKGSVVTAGSVVESDLPEGVIAGGEPARVIGRRDGKPLTNGAARASEEVVAPTHGEAAEKTPEMRGTLVADFSVQELVEHLHTPDELGTVLDAEVAPFGQVVQTLHQLASAEAPVDFALVWTRPESMQSFAALLDGKDQSADDLVGEVRAFAELVLRAAKSARFVFVASWCMPPYHRGFGMRDLKSNGAASALMKMNLALAEALEGAANVHVLDASKWIAAGGRDAVSPKLWYLGKVGYSSDVFAAASNDLKAALRGVRGQAKKLVVLDLDDTLWGGIVGDVGWQNLRLGGHDGVGEAFVDFQRELRALTRRGIALAIVSKNEESVALEAFSSHPEMVLKIDDIVAHRINWIDKAKNVAEIAQELNLGLQSVVFIDDNPVERARVREALPEVFVPEWPKDPLLYASAFLSLRCFDAPVVSKEDAERTREYAAEKKRERLKADVGSIDDWLESLGIKVSFARLGPSNLARTTQLLNKTNQMNLSTRRLSEVELASWAAEPNHELWAITVGDKFGDAGLTGILGMSFEGDRATIADYVLSCRVMGRKVEETLLACAVTRARSRGAREVVAKFVPTPKNKPCFSFFKGSGFAFDEATSTFTWSARQPFAFPKCIAVSGVEMESAQPARAEDAHAP